MYFVEMASALAVLISGVLIHYRFLDPQVKEIRKLEKTLMERERQIASTFIKGRKDELR